MKKLILTITSILVVGILINCLNDNISEKSVVKTNLQISNNNIKRGTVLSPREYAEKRKNMIKNHKSI